MRNDPPPKLDSLDMTGLGQPLQRPARILMYTAYFEPEYSGAALQALTLASELRQRGHYVEFVTNRWPGLSDTAVVQGFAVRRLEPGRMNKHREFRLWFNLTRYIWERRRDFDILHSHGAYYTHAFIGPLAWVLGLKSVVKASLAKNDLDGLSDTTVGKLHQWMLRLVGAYVGTSRDLVEEFRAGGMNPQRIHFVPNGVDTDRFQRPPAKDLPGLRVSLALPIGQPIALYLGVLDARKNILWLAERWVAHNAFGTGALLLAVGPQSRDDPAGALHARLAKLAQTHPQRFALHDFHAEVVPYYQCADILVLPSVNEGLPNVVLEAMASGLPCVAARASGSRELVIDGETGFTYPPDDVVALAEAVQRCLSPAGAAMGERARQYVQERYSIRVVADRYIALYAQLLDRRAAPFQPSPASEAAMPAGHVPTAPRTVLFVENGIGYGGAVTCLRHLVRQLDRSKYEPIVITGQSAGPYAGIAEDAQWFSIQDRRIDATALRRKLDATAWPDRLPGMRWLLLQCIARLDDLANSLPFFLRFSWALLQIRPVIVHVNNEPLCNRAAIVAAWLFRIPLVCHVRGDPVGSRSMAMFIRMPDQFIPVSRWIAASIAKLGVPADHSTLIYDGIDFARLNRNADGAAFRSKHGIPCDAFAVGLPGVLLAWKGQTLLLEAALALAAEFPDLHFVIVGGTPDECRPYELELRNFVAHHGLQSRVTFTGHVADMSDAYSALDVVVSASTSPEPLGVVVVEAMAMRRPVVAPAHGGALEVVEHERTGLLFAPNDAAALASAIRRYRQDAALREQMAVSDHAQVIDTFSITRSAHAVEGLYDRLLAEKQR